MTSPAPPRAELTPGLVVAVLPLVGYPAVVLAGGALRWELVATLVVAPLLAFGGPRTKRLFFGVYPLALIGILYDLMRLGRDVGVTPERVHLCDLRDLELSLFGIAEAGGRITPSDWLQRHASLPVDLVAAVPYGTFLYACVAFTVFAFRKDLLAMKRFGWGFFAVNVLGFATYHLLPAAPPWYYATHGCVVDVMARASEGPNLARVDAVLGVPYFRGMYGRSSDVFGAMPSLHVAYPLLIVLEGYALFGPWLRAASIAFFGTMCFAAVYLEHHWILDVLAGITCAVLVDVGLRRVFAPRPAIRDDAPSAPPAATAPIGGAP